MICDMKGNDTKIGFYVFFVFLREREDKRKIVNKKESNKKGIENREVEGGGLSTSSSVKESTLKLGLTSAIFFNHSEQEPQGFNGFIS